MATFILFLGGFALLLVTWPLFLVVAIVGAILDWRRRALFICEVCAHTFKPE